MLWLLYCLPLLFKVWQRSGSCCWCYNVYHYCLRFDRRLVLVIIVIVSTTTVYDFTKEWFMLLLLYCLPLRFNIWQRSGSYCGCYMLYHYSLRFHIGVVHVVVVILSTITVDGLTEEWFMLFLFCLPLLFKDWQRSGSCCCCYLVYHLCLRFDRGVVHVVIVIMSTITV